MKALLIKEKKCSIVDFSENSQVEDYLGSYNTCITKPYKDCCTLLIHQSTLQHSKDTLVTREDPQDKTEIDTTKILRYLQAINKY